MYSLSGLLTESEDFISKMSWQGEGKKKGISCKVLRNHGFILSHTNKIGKSGEFFHCTTAKCFSRNCFKTVAFVSNFPARIDYSQEHSQTSKRTGNRTVASHGKCRIMWFTLQKEWLYWINLTILSIRHLCIHITSNCYCMCWFWLGES